ncbi:CotO family spore coat protein [Oceanobacillus timonensis]|uniref:CotO family spore coat protein n=1 Tax=Oceanobacillus timonensis TaxID=1926285 RepID=UPI0009BBF89F|nr:CotO family spore coat protein [Oceanobacillus timonensis]
MTDKNKAKSPLLYISQPQLKESAAPMQDNYFGNSGIQKKADVNQAPPVKKPPLKHHKKHVDSTVQKEEQQSSKKKFMEMSINEKIDYLTNRSEFAPPVRCEVIVNGNKKYRGIIREKEEDILFLQLSNRKSSIKIPVEDIENIQLLGF